MTAPHVIAARDLITHLEGKIAALSGRLGKAMLTEDQRRDRADMLRALISDIEADIIGRDPADDFDGGDA